MKEKLKVELISTCLQFKGFNQALITMPIYELFFYSYKHQNGEHEPSVPAE